MDPITHGITGALLGKGFFERYGRAGVAAVTIGAVFPDIDVLAEAFSKSPVAMLRMHRAYTHSLVCLPVFAMMLALMMGWWERRRGRAAPGWGVLSVAFGAGIASHIVLDAMTSYGTQIWDPISHYRAAWDFLVIIDFAFTAIVLLPQVIAWVYRSEAKYKARGLEMWAVFSAGVLGVWRLAQAAGTPFSRWAVIGIVVIMGMAVLLPAINGWGLGVKRASWCRAGIYAAIVYIAGCATAHHVAMARVQKFAREHEVMAKNAAALPFPPALLNWTGLVSTSKGVYAARLHLGDKRPEEFQFIADSPGNRYTAEAEKLPDVQVYLWFARFPVVRESQQDGRNVVEFGDARFTGRREDAPLPFTFRIVFGGDNQVLAERWAERGLRRPWRRKRAAAEGRAGDPAPGGSEANSPEGPAERSPESGPGNSPRSASPVE